MKVINSPDHRPDGSLLQNSKDGLKTITPLYANGEESVDQRSEVGGE